MDCVQRLSFRNEISTACLNRILRGKAWGVFSDGTVAEQF